ncbi:MAG: 50S ribosomal protein L34e, partial [Nanoarchaeota archaeon]
MTEKRMRTRSRRRIQRKVPGGRTVTHYKRRKPQAARCAGCKKPLPGIPRKIPSALHTVAKSSRRPSRPFGGFYCSACMRAALLAQIPVPEDAEN